MNEGEFETVEVKIPRVILDLLKALRINIHEYFTNTIIEGFAADLKASSGPFIENLVERFPELKALISWE